MYRKILNFILHVSLACRTNAVLAETKKVCGICEVARLNLVTDM
jgi:hypothetical protein